MERKIRVVHYAKGRKGQLSRVRAQMTASREFAESFLVLSSRVNEPWEDEWDSKTMVKWFLTAKTALGRLLQEIAIGIWLVRQTQRGQFDLLHIHENTGLIVGAVWALFSRSPLIFDTHDLFSPKITKSSKLISYLFKWIKWHVLQGYVIRHSHYVLHVSPGILEIYKKEFPKARHVLLWNLPAFLLEQKGGEIQTSQDGHSAGKKAEKLNNGKIAFDEKNSKPLRIIYFGLLSSVRISVSLIRLIASIEGVELIIAGRLYEDIDDAKGYADEFHKAVQETRVRWLGAYTNAQLPSLLEEVDLLIHPIPVVNDNTRHALPNKFFESCANGKGLIYSNVFEDMGQIATEYGFGVAFDPENEESIRSVLEELRDHPEKVASMKQNAWKFIINSPYAPESYRKVVKSIYTI